MDSDSPSIGVLADQGDQAIRERAAPCKVIEASIEFTISDRIAFPQKDVAHLSIALEKGIESADFQIEFDRKARTVVEKQNNVACVEGDRPSRRILIVVSDEERARLRKNVADNIGMKEGAVTCSDSATARSNQDYVTGTILDSIVCTNPGDEF